MAKERKLSETETQKITETELKTISIVEVEEELKKLMTTEVKELKNAATDKSESLEQAITEAGKNVTATQTEDMEKVKLKTSDGITFEVELSIVKEMETVQSSLNLGGNDNSVVIPLPNVTSRYLSLIIKYFAERYHLSETGKLDELKEFDKRFVEELSMDELKELLLAANYLNIKNFFELVCKTIASNIKNESVEFTREFFGLVNDYTVEEEAEYQQANSWAFQNIDQD